MYVFWYALNMIKKRRKFMRSFYISEEQQSLLDRYAVMFKLKTASAALCHILDHALQYNDQTQKWGVLKYFRGEWLTEDEHMAKVEPLIDAIFLTPEYISASKKSRIELCAFLSQWPDLFPNPTREWEEYNKELARRGID